MTAADETLLFISHASGDAESAQRIEAALRARGVPCWMAPRDVEPGEPFDEAINRALARCTAVLLLVSEPAAESRHVKRELIIADNRRKMIIPLRLEPIEPKKLSYHLADSQWIDWEQGSDPVVDRIAARVRNGPVSEPVTVPREPVPHPAPSVPDAKRGIPVAVWAVLGAVVGAGALYLAISLLGGRSAAPAGTAASPVAGNTASPTADPQLGLTPDRSAVTEGESMTFIVSRPPNSPAQTVYFSLVDQYGNPMRRGNINMPGGGEPQDAALQFQEGEEIQRVPLEVLNDNVPDDGEKFSAVLTSGPGGLKLKGSITITVWDRGDN